WLRDVTIGNDETLSDVEPAADKFILGNGRVALGRQRFRRAATLNSAAAIVLLCFGITQRATGSSLDKVERTRNQANPTAVLTAQLHGQRETVLQLFGRLVDVG